jgi:hypothetical protein
MRPDPEPRRITVIVTGIIAACVVAAFTVACVERLVH